MLQVTYIKNYDTQFYYAYVLNGSQLHVTVDE